MSSENAPCVDGPGIRGEVRAWSEDPLTARVRSVWSGADFLPIAHSFAPAAVTELFATCYGPTVATLRATDPDAASRLRGELTRLFQAHNLASDGATAVAGEYLDVQARIA